MNAIPRSLRWASLLSVSAALAFPAIAAAQTNNPTRERQQRLTQEQLLERFDTNRDGVLSEEEREAARATMRSERPGPARGERANRAAGERANLTPEEREARRAAARARLEARFDANQDGVLDAEERAAMEAHIAERRAQRAAQRAERAEQPDQPRRGRQVTPEQREARRAEMLKRFDANQDGVLDEQERATMQATLQAEREARRAQRAPNPNN